MSWRFWHALLLGALLALTRTGATAALSDTSASATNCSIAAGHDASHNTLTCNFGLTPEQLRQATKAAVEGATGPLMDRIEDISQKLGVTKNAARTLLKVVGEDPNIPDDKLAEALTKAAADYRRLQSQARIAAALARDNPIAQNLVAQAKAEINDGHLAQAHELLRQATQAQLAAAHAARKLRERAQAAEDAQMLGAASATAAEGGLALTERHYTEAANLFGRASEYVPSGPPGERLV